MSNTRTILVVSDLHLGDGGYLEDFSADDAFQSFAQYHANKPGAHLVLNGDTIDFLQIQPLGAYTLHSAPAKVHAMAAAHPKFMQALADYSLAGNDISVIEGNHDIEFLFESVQTAFLDCLRAAGADLARVHFVKSQLAEPPLYHIEHGHQADRLNRFDYDNLLLSQETGSLNYPWGSYFVHRVFNHVEPAYRFIDKIRPESAAALLLRLVDPQRFDSLVLPTLGLQLEDSLDQQIGRLRRAAMTLGPIAGAICKGAPEAGHALGVFANDWEPILDDFACGAAAAPLPSAQEYETKGRISDYFLGKTILHLQDSSQSKIHRSKEYVDAALSRSMSSGAKIVVFGHTHHGLRHLLSNGSSYINSGTWTPLLRIPDPDQGEQWVDQLRQLVHYPVINRPSYVEITIEDRVSRARLMSWDVQHERPVPEE